MYAKNIRYLRKRRGWTQQDLAGKVGYKSAAAINKWESGDNKPTYATLQAVAGLFGVRVEDLMDVDIEERDAEAVKNIGNISTPAARAVPVLGAICCGSGIECHEEYCGVFFVDNSIRADLCLEVIGDSMSGVGIENGDKAFLLKNCSYDNGKIYGVVIGEEETAVLRKIYWQDRKLILAPCNEAYKPIVTTEEEARIIGECVGVYHPVK